MSLSKAAFIIALSASVAQADEIIVGSTTEVQDIDLPTACESRYHIDQIMAYNPSYQNGQELTDEQRTAAQGSCESENDNGRTIVEKDGNTYILTGPQ